MAIDDRGDLVDEVPVGDSVHYHPGGMDFDGTRDLDPVRPSTGRTRPPACIGFEPGGRRREHVFDVDDHVGAIARCGSRRRPRRLVVGLAPVLPLDHRRSRCSPARVNPAFFVDHQDCQWLDDRTPAVRRRRRGEPRRRTRMARRTRAARCRRPDDASARCRFRSTRPTGRVGTHNPLWAEVRGDQLVLHLLPDDGLSTILSYATPLVGRSGVERRRSSRHVADVVVEGGERVRRSVHE